MSKIKEDWHCQKCRPSEEKTDLEISLMVRDMEMIPEV